MDRNELSLRLLSGPVSDEQHHLRLGFWLRIAREDAGKSQEGAARELGLSAASKSTISDWENGVREPKLSQLRVLARYYGVPMDLFVTPPPTAFEDLARVKELAAAALDAEAADWASEELATGPAAEGVEGEQPGTRSA
jgi:transcriptional regulator with XRE-family HTH domain